MDGVFELQGESRGRLDDLVRALETSGEGFRRMAVSGVPEPVARAFRELARVRRAQVEELRPWARVHASPSSGGVHRELRLAWPAQSRALKDGRVGPLLEATARLEGSLEALFRDLAAATLGTPLSPILTRELERSRPALEGVRALAAPGAKAA